MIIKEPNTIDRRAKLEARPLVHTEINSPNRERLILDIELGKRLKTQFDEQIAKLAKNLEEANSKLPGFTIRQQLDMRANLQILHRERSELETKLKGLCDKLWVMDNPPEPSIALGASRGSSPSDPEAISSETAAIDPDFAALLEATGNLSDDETHRLADALGQIIDWIIPTDFTMTTCGQQNSFNKIGRRAVALAWVLSPERFKGASLRTLAKSLGVAAPALSVFSAEASRRFKIDNTFQSHDWKN